MKTALKYTVYYEAVLPWHLASLHLISHTPGLSHDNYPNRNINVLVY